MASKRNAISELPRYVQGQMLESLLAGVSEVPLVYIVPCNPLRFVTLQKRSHAEVPAIVDISHVIDGIMGGPTSTKYKDFDFQDEMRSQFGQTIRFETLGA